jgi:hypothetical protein
LDESLGNYPLIKGGQRSGYLYFLVQQPHADLDRALNGTDHFSMKILAIDAFATEWDVTVDFRQLGARGVKRWG